MSYFVGTAAGSVLLFFSGFLASSTLIRRSLVIFSPFSFCQHTMKKTKINNALGPVLPVYPICYSFVSANHLYKHNNIPLHCTRGHFFILRKMATLVYLIPDTPFCCWKYREITREIHPLLKIIPTTHYFLLFEYWETENCWVWSLRGIFFWQKH